MKTVVVKLTGTDVMDVITPPGIEVEVRQYHADHQDPEMTQEETHWPNLIYEVVHPPQKKKPTSNRPRR